MLTDDDTRRGLIASLPDGAIALLPGDPSFIVRCRHTPDGMCGACAVLAWPYMSLIAKAGKPDVGAVALGEALMLLRLCLPDVDDPGLRIQVERFVSEREVSP